MAEINALIGLISKIRGLEYSSRKDVVSAAVLHGCYEISGTKFLSALFDEAVNAAASPKLGEEEVDLIETFAACCQVCLTHCHASLGIVHQFLDSFFLPVLSLPHFSPSFYTQVSTDLLSLIKSRGGDFSSLVAKCSGSLLSLLETKTQRTTDSIKLFIPLHTCCCLIPGLIDSGGVGVIKVLLPLSFRLLRSNDDSLASASLKNIIMPIIVHYKSVNDVAAIESMKIQLMSCCVDMMKQPGAHRRNALIALVQLPPTLTPPSIVTEESSAQDPISEIEKEFWQELIGCLSSKDDSLDRKRALYVLQQILGPALSSPPWSIWMSFFSIIEEFAIHLIKPLWGAQIDKLHTPSTNCSNLNEPQGKLKIGLNGRVDKIRGKGKDEKTSDATTHRLHMKWHCIIWVRAFSHPNVLMRRLALRTFLNRAWDNPLVVSEVPLSFVTCALLPTLLSEEVHYSPSSADDEYTGGNEASSTDVQDLASRWLSCWLNASPPADKREVIRCFLSLTISSRDIPRSCLLPAWTIFSQALLTSTVMSDRDDGFVDKAIFSLKSCRTTLVSLPSGMQLKKNLALCLLQAASVIAPTSSCTDVVSVGPLDLIIDLPSAWTSPQGHLNAICR